MFDNLSTMPTNKIKSTSNDNGLTNQQYQVQSSQQHRDASRVEEANTDSQAGQDSLGDDSRGESLQASDRKSLMATVKNLNEKLENQVTMAIMAMVRSHLGVSPGVRRRHRRHREVSFM